MKKQRKIWIKIRKNTWTPPFFPHGWGNGYVVIADKNHPDYGKDYMTLHYDVHGGITFGEVMDRKRYFEFFGEELPEGIDEVYVIGFDTAHWGDNEITWNKDAVIDETIWLASQVNERNI